MHTEQTLRYLTMPLCTGYKDVKLLVEFLFPFRITIWVETQMPDILLQQYAAEALTPPQMPSHKREPS